MSVFRKFDFGSKTLSQNGNYTEIIMDEVSLEGLDGVTFDALLVRLQQLKGFQISFDQMSSKEFLFQVLRHKLSSQSKKDYNENSESIRGKKLFYFSILWKKQTVHLMK